MSASLELGQVTVGHVHPLSPRGLLTRIRAHPWLWPLVTIRDTWLTAVESEVAIGFNLRLLAAASVVLSTPDIVTGAVQAFGAHGPQRGFGIFVLSLGAAEAVGGTLLFFRPAVGRFIVLACAAGAYVEAALALGHFEQSLFSVAIYVGSMAAEAWVIWFLLHPRTRAHVRVHPQRLRFGSS